MAPKLIIQAGNMTGDMFGVAAALLLCKDYHVVLLSEGSKRDKTDSLRDFYVATLGGNRDRVHVLRNLQNISESYTQYTARADTRQPLPYTDTEPPIPESLQDKNLQSPISEATSAVAANWSKKRPDDIRKAWKSRSFDEQIKRYLDKRGIPYKGGQSYAILWSRFSGKKGGPHAQHDTSFEGMRQLVALARKSKRIVLIVGDHNPSRSSENKYKWLETMDKEGVFDLAEFWMTLDWKTVCPDDRMAQFALFDFLHAQSNGNLKHLGFRSGNLEIYALLGHQVRYMEEIGNRETKRMLRWKKLGYELITVSKVPSKTGQWVVAENIKNKEKNNRHEAKPPWINDENKRKEESIDPNATRGFNLEDLKKLEAYFQDPSSNDQLIQNLADIQEYYAAAEQHDPWPRGQK
ncbi:hypothetical protein BO221_10280 [Archangium sp. Cb G35]|uniref:hypothetical protein n=1 Tax=Archangium sp. Cb G35 TaxID=1920190 RepID=UPI0009368190|nr:hypothetical protein [Archangium sp. Cb G35]OJT26193.1 hypothetical protein BO221_10280 [Archangium sp. Cb G35]